MKPIRTKAIVLRRTNYGEADRILQLLTPDHGKLSVMAKGVRREKSKLAGGIELFGVCDVSLISGKSEIFTLTGAQLETFYQRIMTDYGRLQFGYEAIKQVARAVETVSEPAFFELLQTTFVSLNDLSIDTRLTQTWFWLQLSILLGVGLNLATDQEGRKLVESKAYQYDIELSAFVPHDKGQFTAEHIKLLRLLSAQLPKVAAKVKGASELIGESLWLAERTFSH